MKTAVQLPRKSVSAWVLTGVLAAGAALGMAQNAKAADTYWSVSVAQPGVIMTVGGGAPVYPAYPVVQTYPAYPVVYEQPVVVQPRPVTIIAPPHHHPPHGVAHGYWRHHHRHHGHHGHHPGGHDGFRHDGPRYEGPRH